MATNEEPKYRQPPNNLEAEQALLGAILVNNNAYDRVSEFLKPQHFFEPLHQQIFAIASDLIMQNRTANPVTVKQFLPEDQEIGSGVTVGHYLARLAAEAVSIINAADYARGIYDLAIRRELIRIGEDMVNNAFDSPLDFPPMAQIEDAESELLRIGKAASAGSGEVEFEGNEIATQYLASVTKDPNKQSGSGVPIVLKEIATVTSERVFEEGNFYGLISSSGEGKTSLTLQIIYRALIDNNPVLFLSYDQTGTQCVQQMVAQNHGIEMRRQKLRDITDKEVDRGYSFARELSKMPFQIKDCNGSKDGIAQITRYAKAFVKKWRALGKTPFIVIDHIGSIMDDKADLKADEGTKAKSKGYGLKALAKELHAVVLVLVQRSTTGMKRKNPRPIAQDLYGGESAKQPYDGIFYLYRAEEHMNNQLKTADNEKQQNEIRANFEHAFGGPVEGLAEVGTIKCRFGPNNLRRKIAFVPEYTRYESIYHAADEDQTGFF